MSPRRLVLERLAEIRHASPATKVVVVANDADARWLGAALVAGASAVVPGGSSSNALGTVLQEVLDSDTGSATRSSMPPEDRAPVSRMLRSDIDQGREI